MDSEKIAFQMPDKYETLMNPHKLAQSPKHSITTLEAQFHKFQNEILNNAAHKMTDLKFFFDVTKLILIFSLFSTSSA